MKTILSVLCIVFAVGCDGEVSAECDATSGQAVAANPLARWAQVTVEGGGTQTVTINGGAGAAAASLDDVGTALRVVLSEPIVGACGAVITPARPDISCMATCRGTYVGVTCLNIGGAQVPFPGHNFRDGSATTLSLAVFP